MHDVAKASARQQLYDTIYQERYMGLPKDKPRSTTWDRQSNFAERLKRRVLRIDRPFASRSPVVENSRAELSASEDTLSIQFQAFHLHYRHAWHFKCGAE